MPKKKFRLRENAHYKGLKIVNHLKRHLSKPDELVKAMKTGIIKVDEWLVIDAGLKSGIVLRWPICILAVKKATKSCRFDGG